MKLLILNGSPRKKGTSFRFSEALKAQAEHAGGSAEIVHIINCFDGKMPLREAAAKIGASDAVAIIAPLYVDTLPYPAIWFLEQLYAHHKDVLAGKNLFAVGQCGFPDTTRMIPMMNTCRHFADQTSMTWIGGLSYGGGAILDGRPVCELGKTGERISAAFCMAIDAVQSGTPIPPQAQELLAVRIPKWMFRPLALLLNHNSKKKAHKLGTDVRRKVYLED